MIEIAIHYVYHFVGLCGEQHPSLIYGGSLSAFYIIIKSYKYRSKK